MSDSDSDDIPLSRKVAVAKKPTTAPTKNTQPDKKAAGRPSPSAAKKPVAVKKEPSKAAGAKVKQEQNGSTSTGAEKKVREKKEYDLPGQTRETPPETDALRKYYTSLLQQRPDSQLARKWCVQHGLLPREEALQWLAEAGKKLKSPVKAENGRQAGVKRAADSARAARPPAKKVKPEPKVKAEPRSTPVRKAKKDVAFSDGGLDSDSDDDQPLVRRLKA